MNNDYDADLGRLFAEMPEPAQDEVFTGQVSRRIEKNRSARRIMQILLGVIGVGILAVLTPWLMSLVGYIMLGSDLFAKSILIVFLSPAGWAIGGWVGLLAFLKAR